MTGARSEAQPFVVAGRRAVLEAVRAGRARAVWVGGGSKGAGLSEVMAACASAGIAPEIEDDTSIEARARGIRHQGVVAEVTLPAELGEADLARCAWGEEALVLVLDGVTDPHNLGACARSAEAAGAEAIVTRRHRGAAVTPAAVRASAGALLHLRLARVANITKAIGRLREAGFWIVGLDAAGERALREMDPPPGRRALVVGAEGEGLSRLVREACDETVSIPMRGRVDSLNVSVAAGIALFHGLALWPEKEGSG